MKHGFIPSPICPKPRRQTIPLQETRLLLPSKKEFFLTMPMEKLKGKPQMKIYLLRENFNLSRK